MKVLFIHQNFPGQFKHLAPALVQRGDEVVALTLRQLPAGWGGVRVVNYAVQRGSTAGVHPWVSDFETKVIRGEACFRAALQLRDSGFTPDVIVAHPAWGESLFLKQVWPAARLGLYSEFFFHPDGADTGFDPEFPTSDPAGDACRLDLRNLTHRLHFDLADAGIAPTHWQASTFPAAFRARIAVIHDGIDTDAITPADNARITLTREGQPPLVLTRADEVITFVSRNLEPYRGYHTFLRALPDLLARRPQARVLVIGGDGVSYGSAPPPGTTWKQHYIDEVRGRIPAADWARVHFLGHIPHDAFVQVLQVSRVHTYLTYPFVLSWSLLEAMSAGCAIVASDTPPLHEAIRDDETGRLTDFFDPAALSHTIIALLDDAPARARLGAAARAFARERYDLQRVCLPAQLTWLDGLAAMP